MKIEITKGENNPVTDFFSSPSNTPETDAFLRDLNDYSDVELRAMTEHARKLERERDEARGEIESVKLQLGLWEDGNLICEETLGEIRLLEEQIKKALLDRDEAREQNAKLRDIAERLFAAGVGRMKTDDWRTLRAELDQLKEGAK
jgi:hypothetical protein